MLIDRKVSLVAAAIAFVGVGASFSPANAFSSTTEMSVGITITAPVASSRPHPRVADASNSRRPIATVDGGSTSHSRDRSAIARFAGTSHGAPTQTDTHVYAGTVVLTRSY